MSQFTIDDVIAKVRELAAADPEFVYSGDAEGYPVCKYIHKDDQPGCIFGQALLALGVSPDRLREYDDTEDSTITSILCQLAGADRIADAQKLAWCGQCQRAQDSNEQWAEAIREADQKYPIS